MDIMRTRYIDGAGVYDKRQITAELVPNPTAKNIICTTKGESMNTLQELIDNGIQERTAHSMLESYSEKIGTMNGIYVIKDIYYDFGAKGKIVELECTGCGKKMFRTIISGRNKWSELIKSCECQKNKKNPKIKKASEKKPKPTKEPKQCQRFLKYDDGYIGKKNNMLEVVGITRNAKGNRVFLCLCDCGNLTEVKPTYWETGQVKSCGCYSEQHKLEHSEELDRIRRIYGGMIQRCYNSNSDAYKYYGGRGIIICKEWLDDREAFIGWALDNGYSNDLSIDRISVNGNYEPRNCRWATAKEQNNNQRPRTKGLPRKRKTIFIDGIEKPIVEWYEIYEVTAPTVAYRMKHFKMNFEEALKMPKITMGRPRKEG